jgi:hypothetical protein
LEFPVRNVLWSSLLLAACGPTYLAPEAGDESNPAERAGNWADEDTDGVGTHRVTAATAQVRDADRRVVDTATAGQQLVLTQASYQDGGTTWFEAVFKGGELDSTFGWVSSPGLAYSVLTVCNTSSAQIRDGADLGRVVGNARSGSKLYVDSRTVRNTGNHRYFYGSVNGIRGWVATSYLCQSGSSGGSGGGSTSRSGLADQLLDSHASGETVLWNQTFGRYDGASPLDNVRDTAAGRAAKTSCYGGAPCDQVYLDEGLLRGMNDLRDQYGFDYFVTAIAGASHSWGSLHYDGRAFDLDEINGVRIQGDSSAARRFMDACRALGAIEVFGPSNDPSGHWDHIHCAW